MPCAHSMLLVGTFASPLQPTSFGLEYMRRRDWETARLGTWVLGNYLICLGSFIETFLRQENKSAILEVTK